MSTDYATTPTLGCHIDVPKQTQEHALGTVVHGNGNTIWIYTQASAGTVATGTCTVNDTTFLLTDAAGDYTADTAFAQGDYGWVRLTAQVT